MIGNNQFVNPWTKEQLGTLRSLAGIVHFTEIANRIGRTPSAVLGRAQVLGLRLRLPVTNPRSKYKGTGKREHVLVVEKVLGRPLPKGAIVHHINHNGQDNRPANLVLCPSRAYHNLIHARERALDACGHADWIKCAYCHKYDRPDAMVWRRSGGLGGRFHKRCQADYAKARDAQ